MAVLQVLPSNQEHVVVPPPFPQVVQFRASQSGSAHTAASVVPTGSSAVSRPELGAPPQATSSSPDSIIRVEVFMLRCLTVFSLEWV